MKVYVALGDQYEIVTVLGVFDTSDEAEAAGKKWEGEQADKSFLNSYVQESEYRGAQPTSDVFCKHGLNTAYVCPECEGIELIVPAPDHEA